jgi:glycyl-tRNA synthetase (class II)
MKKVAIFILTLVVVSAFLFVSAYSQEEMTFIDNSVFANPERSPSIFHHDEHNEKAEIEECNTCHHVYENGKLIEDESSEDQRCSDCHELKASDNKPALMKAYHTNCKECHMKEKKGPVMCGECHQK